MESGIVFAGVLVVLGLLMESWPEIQLAIKEGRFPKLTVTGGVIVTVGVLIEVVLGIFITQRANRAQSEANERVANALERAATAERIAAEANLARVKIEERIAELSSPRRLTEEQFEAFKTSLIPFPDTRVDLFVFDNHLIETSFFTEQLTRLFLAAGWKPKVWNCTGALRLSGASLSMAVRSDQFVSEGPIPLIQWIMVSLCGDFFKLRIECTSLSAGFDPNKTFSAWEMKEHNSWDLNDVAPLRIQVGAKQHIPLIDQIGDLRTISPPRP
jgi:hypothetical protein